MTLNRVYRTVRTRLFTLVVIATACLGSGCTSPSLFTTDPQADEVAANYTRILRAAAAVRESGDVATASMLYDRAHQLNPEDAAPLLALGEIAASAGTPGQAARALREALRCAPDDINARRLYGNALLAVDAPAQAAEQFRHVLGVEPQDTRALNALGVSLDLQGEHEEAQRIYRSALELRPDHLPLRNNLALSIALTGNTTQALAMLQGLADRSRGSGAPHDDSLHHEQVHENILMVLALSGDVAGTAPGRRLEVARAARKPPVVLPASQLLATARLSTLASGLAPAAGGPAAPPASDGYRNRLDWSSIEDIIRNGPMTLNWLEPHIPPPADWRKM